MEKESVSHRFPLDENDSGFMTFIPCISFAYPSRGY